MSSHPSPDLHLVAVSYGQRGPQIVAPIDFQPEPWVKNGACRGLGTDMFFPKRGESLREIRAVCAACPVRQECLDYALRNNLSYGFFGGKSERERRRMRVERNKALRAAREAS